DERFQIEDRKGNYMADRRQTPEDRTSKKTTERQTEHGKHVQPLTSLPLPPQEGLYKLSAKTDDLFGKKPKSRNPDW
ncbi:unnamed protein product, partial [Amoebophrya sp. A25]